MHIHTLVGESRQKKLIKLIHKDYASFSAFHVPSGIFVQIQKNILLVTPPELACPQI